MSTMSIIKSPQSTRISPKSNAISPEAREERRQKIVGFCLLEAKRRRQMLRDQKRQFDECGEEARSIVRDFCDNSLEYMTASELEIPEFMEELMLRIEEELKTELELNDYEDWSLSEEADRWPSLDFNDSNSALCPVCQRNYVDASSFEVRCLCGAVLSEVFRRIPNFNECMSSIFER